MLRHQIQEWGVPNQCFILLTIIARLAQLCLAQLVCVSCTHFHLQSSAVAMKAVKTANKRGTDYYISTPKMSSYPDRSESLKKLQRSSATKELIIGMTNRYAAFCTIQQQQVVCVLTFVMSCSPLILLVIKIARLFYCQTFLKSPSTH